MSQMVVGFIFSPDWNHVVLIEKERPEWQAGLLNGVGGKPEKSDKGPRATMARECMEECGLMTEPQDWTIFAELLEPTTSTRVVFMYVRHPLYEQAESKTDERVGVYPTCDIASRATIPNLQWLIPCAMNWEKRIGPSRCINIVIMEKPV